MKLLVLLCALAGSCFVNAASAQSNCTPAAPLGTPVHVEGGNLGYAGLIESLAKQYRCVIGYEDTEQLGERRHLSRDVDGRTIKENLDLIFAAAPGYVLATTASGRYYVHNVNGPPTPGSVLLDFPGIASGTRRQVFNILYKQPELDRWAAENHCAKSWVQTGHEWSGDGPTITIPKGPIALRDLLDQATAQSDRLMWTVKRYQTDTGCQLSLSLW